mmetsp:Transcript_3110/g.5173  ORF Transcript_3110/g.5173 Transcript_3110/m.5173 type:complete len:227 (+) Transcript_3110:123-803(+)
MIGGGVDVDFLQVLQLSQSLSNNIPVRGIVAGAGCQDAQPVGLLSPLLTTSCCCGGRHFPDGLGLNRHDALNIIVRAQAGGQRVCESDCVATAALRSGETGPLLGRRRGARPGPTRRLLRQYATGAAHLAGPTPLLRQVLAHDVTPAYTAGDTVMRGLQRTTHTRTVAVVHEGGTDSVNALRDLRTLKGALLLGNFQAFVHQFMAQSCHFSLQLLAVLFDGSQLLL